MNSLEIAKFHPVANIFPLMEGDEFDALVADIDKNGLIEPVIMLVDEADGKKKILDGRNRWRACQALGIAHKEINFDQLPTGPDDPTAYVWSKNVQRRQLNPGQIAMAAEKLETLRHGQRPDSAVKGETSGEVSAPKTRRKIAKETGASPASIDKARRVKRDGTPELAQKVEAGEITLNAADRIARLPKEEQEKVMADEAPAKAAARKEQARQKRPVTRKAPSPAVTMREHMTGHQSGIRDVQLVNKYWAEHPDEILKLDPEDLRRFIKTVEESRRAASQLLTLIGEKVLPEWTLPGKQPALLSTALNKVDAAQAESKEESE